VETEIRSADLGICECFQEPKDTEIFTENRTKQLRICGFGDVNGPRLDFAVRI